MNSPHALNLSFETWQLQLQLTLISHPKCYRPVGLKSFILVPGRNEIFLSDTGGFAHPHCKEQIWLEFTQADLEELKVSQQGVAATQPRKGRSHKLHRTGAKH